MTHPTRRRTLQAVATTGLAGLAGCLAEGDVFGSSDDSDADGDADSSGDGTLGNPADEVTVTVIMRPSPQFDPGLVHVEPGGTVRWDVEGQRHTVTAYHPDADGRPQRIPDGAEPFASDLLREGHEYERTFDDPGVYDYLDTRRLCGSHEALGAVGRVVVGRPDLANQPALEHDVTELPSRAETVMQSYDDEVRAVLEG